MTLAPAQGRGGKRNRRNDSRVVRRRQWMYAVVVKYDRCLVAAATVLLAVGLEPASAEPDHVAASARIPPLLLALPHWPPLNEKQITEAISGRIATVNYAYEPYPGVKVSIIHIGGCPPSETFFADGRWRMGVCQRAFRVYEGRWKTEAFRGGQRLCVEATDSPKSCRFVWQGSTTHELFLSPGEAENSGETGNSATPYTVIADH